MPTATAPWPCPRLDIAATDAASPHSLFVVSGSVYSRLQNRFLLVTLKNILSTDHASQFWLTPCAFVGAALTENHVSDLLMLGECKIRRHIVGNLEQL
jgi:hypothetical protein